MNGTSSAGLSVVIPAFDEERRLPHTLRAVLAYLRANEPSWEVVVVDDGSADATAAVVRRAARDEPRLRLLRWPVNRGKGHAVRVGVLASAGRTILLCDADLATPIDELPLLQVALAKGASAAVGSRAVDGARLETRQDRMREVFGRLGNAESVQPARRPIAVPFTVQGSSLPGRRISGVVTDLGSRAVTLRLSGSSGLTVGVTPRVAPVKTNTTVGGRPAYRTSTMVEIPDIGHGYNAVASVGQPGGIAVAERAAAAITLVGNPDDKSAWTDEPVR